MDKIAKLLNLTKSDNDNEALAAIRMANKLLGEKGLGWENFLKPKAIKSTAVYSHDVGDYDGQLVEVFESLIQSQTGTTRKFLISLYSQYKLTGRLSDKQLDVLMKIHKNS